MSDLSGLRRSPSAPEIFGRDGAVIDSLHAWEVHGRPALPEHWAPQRSAMELAISWLTGEGRALAADALGTRPSLRNLRVKRAVAEAQTRFDAFSGPRNHDLLASATAAGGRIALSVEAKADEPFGATVGEYRDAALEKARSEPTNAPARLEGLLAAIVGLGAEHRPELAALRYQLFTAVAGTLAAAAAAEEHADAAVLLIQEFNTPLTSATRQATNDADLAAFLLTVFGERPPAAAPWCLGPFTVPGSERIPGDVPLYVAKVRVDRPGRLNSRFDAAVTYAREHHVLHPRKGTRIPYLAHLLAVAALTLEMEGSEDEAIAALLHDVIEDGGGPAAEAEIRARFGEEVARIVRACSDTDEDPKPPWPERKRAYLAAIATKRPDELRVSLADKLHNARAILLDLRTHGETLWERFNRGRDDQLWYYGELAAAFRARASDIGPAAAPAIGELERVVNEITRAAAGPPSRDSDTASDDRGPD